MAFNQLKLPPIPFFDRATNDISRVWRDLLDNYASLLGSFPWTQLDFTDSNITDIETRNHNDLQNIGEADEASADATKDKHVSNLQVKTLSERTKSNGVLLWLSM